MVNILISFATLDEVAGETKYFKKQCIAHQLSELSTEYRDVSGGRQPANADRVHAYGAKLEELSDWARSGRDKIMALHAAGSKPGHKLKQELELWAKARKPAKSLILKIEKGISNLGVPASGESLALRAEKHKAQKDHKKSKRRKKKRSQSVLTSRVTPPSSREPRLVQMCKKAQSQATPASLSATQHANDSSDVMLTQQRCAWITT